MDLCWPVSKLFDKGRQNKEKESEATRLFPPSFFSCAVQQLCGGFGSWRPSKAYSETNGLERLLLEIILSANNSEIIRIGRMCEGGLKTIPNKRMFVCVCVKWWPLQWGEKKYSPKQNKKSSSLMKQREAQFALRLHAWSQRKGVLLRVSESVEESACPVA